MPYCENKGQQLYYEVHGEGRPLFFIHSYLTSIDLWRAQIDHFAKSYRVIAMDLRGHGQSAISQPHSLYDMVDDACTVLDAVGVQRRVVWALNRRNDFDEGGPSMSFTGGGIGFVCDKLRA